jgi:hypothetical protein
MKVSSLIVGAVLFMAGLTACPGNPSVDPNAILSIEVSPNALTLEVGQSASGLSAVAKNANGNVVSGAAFTWSSSDPSVLQVDSSSGKVTALKGGTAQIQASSAGVQGAAGINISFTLRLEASAFGESAMTVFLSNADGSLIQAETVTPAERSKLFTFENVPGDAFITGAYKVRKPVYTCRVDPCNYVLTDVIRLRSYHASYANERTFSPAGNNEYIQDLSVTVQKPTVVNVDRASGIWPHFSGTRFFGQNPSLIMYDSLFNSDVQSDGKYSPFFVARDSNDNPLAYATLLDQSVTSNFSNALSVGVSDWKTDFSTLGLAIVNYDGYKFNNVKSWSANSPMVLGQRKNAFYDGIFQNPTYSSTSNTLTSSLKYPPNFFDTFGYNTGIGTGDSTVAGYPRQWLYLARRDLGSLPSTLTLDAKSDFLQAPTNLSVTDATTAQPKSTWVKSGNLTTSSNFQKGTTFGIYDWSGPANWDYEWYFDRLSEDQNNLTIPQLPSTLGAEFSPADTTTYKHVFEVRNYEENYTGQYNYRTGFASITPSFVPTLTSAGANQKNLSLEQSRYNPETPDPFAIVLK